VKTIVDCSLADFYTPPLAGDQQFVALAAAIDPLLQQFVADLQSAIIYANIGNQPESLLDYLALYCFDVDYYDPSLPLNTKLLLIEDVIYRKAIKGTPFAIRHYLGLAFGSAVIIEWWQEPQYGNPVGQPNTFRVQIADPLVDTTKVASIIRLIIQVKNARSWFGGISSMTYAKMPIMNAGVGYADYAIYALLKFPVAVI
jgi:phage tail P2-like protein